QIAEASVVHAREVVEIHGAILSTRVLRTDVAVSFALPQRAGLRAVRLREKAAAMDADRVRHRLHGLSVLHCERRGVDRRRRGARRRAVGRDGRGMVRAGRQKAGTQEFKRGRQEAGRLAFCVALLSQPFLPSTHPSLNSYPAAFLPSCLATNRDLISASSTPRWTPLSRPR